MAKATIIRSLSRVALATAAILLASCDLDSEWSSVARPFEPPAEHVASVGGTVTDFSTGLPIAGALVQVGLIDGGPYSATSASNGAYEVREVRMTQAFMTASKPGYETAVTYLPLAPGYNAMPLRLQLSVATTEP